MRNQSDPVALVYVTKAIHRIGVWQTCQPKTTQSDPKRPKPTLDLRPKATLRGAPATQGGLAVNIAVGRLRLHQGWSFTRRPTPPPHT